MATSKKITDLTALSSATSDDVLVIVDAPAGASPETKKITVANFFGNVQANAVFTQPIKLTSNVFVYSGSATTRAGVISQVGASGANGSVYLSTAGKIYLKVNTAGANTDWQRVTTTAVD